MIYSFNKQVACEPIANRTVASEVKSGFAVVKNKVELVKLKVLFDTVMMIVGEPLIFQGDHVYIKGDAVNHDFAKTVYMIDGINFILIPLQFVQMVENE